MPTDGYAQVYVGNESDADVWFDDFTIAHHPGLQVQENHYDPLGMELVGLSRSGGLKQLNQYHFDKIDANCTSITS